MTLTAEQQKKVEQNIRLVQKVINDTWPIGQVRDQREKACTPLGV